MSLRQPTEAEIDRLIERLKNGDQRAIARLMTFVENDIDLAAMIVRKLYPLTGNAYIIGITGPPGAGKSSIINAMIEHFVSRRKRVGVIAVDPTSPFSGGALLGDRIRMKKNFTLKEVFIRSMANRGQLGGLARATKDMVKILDAAGYDIILIETVGVGQSEVDIFKSAHTTVVVVIPGMGDEIQAIKAGIMEITDIFVVNKMDLAGADRKVSELEAMLDLSESFEVDERTHSVHFVRGKGWRPPVIKTNAITGENIPEFIELIEQHREYLEKNDLLTQRLNRKYKNEVLDILKYKLTAGIERLIYRNPKIDAYIGQIIRREKDPYSISEDIMKRFVHLGDSEG